VRGLRCVLGKGDERAPSEFFMREDRTCSFLARGTFSGTVDWKHDLKTREKKPELDD